MTASEHSTLVFLLNAIEAVPSKSGDLLALAERKEASDSFRIAVRDLRHVAGDEKALLAKSEQMRKSLR
jgi:hypothetical protein